MPNRIIKESIRTSRKINELTDFQFRLWLYLITYVDDYGRGSADPELIKGFVFPRRKRISESDIGKALAELVGMGCISLYKVDGESYFCFPNWSEHQRIQTKKSKFPSPEEGVLCDESQNPTVSHGESPPESESEIESESKRKSKEKEAAPPASAPMRHKYGEYSNVLLSDADMEKLKIEFPSDWQERIERLSSYMASSGKGYKSHLATIKNWARKDQERQKEQKSSAPVIEGDIEF